MSRPRPRGFASKPLAAAIVAGLLIANPAVATTRTVTSCTDNGIGTLRLAISASASGDTVDMTALRCAGPIALNGTELPITVNALTIQGPGSDLLTIDAGSQSRILRHDGTGSLFLSGLTFAHGSIAGSGNQDGGCVRSNGSVSATDTVLSNCKADSANGAARGGAVFASGNVALVRSRVTASRAHSHTVAAGGGVWVHGDLNCKYSTIDANIAAADDPPEFYTAQSDDGGLFVGGGGEVRGSTISGNKAMYVGGGEFGVLGGTIDIVNSTISGNEAGVRIGGLSLGSATLSNSTVAFNHEYTKYASGVLARPDGNLELQSTIIAMNTADSESTGIDFRRGSSATVTGSHNLIRTSIGALPADTLRGDPLLAALADNGGATMTHAITQLSPALDAGNNAVPLINDQRGTGFRRVAGMAADIGAYEFDDTIFADGFD